MPDDLPARIGAYPVRGLIGTGSMGVVYLCHDPAIDRQVAVKTIHRQLLEAPDDEHNASARFRIEAQAAGRLSHRNIVSVYQFGEDAASAYIVMEYVAGHSLRDYLRRTERFSKAEVLCLMVQLLEALQFAHERGVVHRDIKPANLIVADDGLLKISDFGIARMEASQVTRVNTVIGSPGYMAPEQYTAGAQDARVDVFAAGVVLYQLLTGTAPFSGTDEAVMYQIVYEPHQSAVQRSGDATLAIYEDVIGTALAKDPAKRFASARAFMQALRKISPEPPADAIERSRLMPPREAIGQADAPTVAMRPRPSSSPSPSPSPSRPPASGGGGSAGSGGSIPSEPVPTGWEDADLAGLEKDLARHVGPVARVLVRRAARGQTDLQAIRLTVAAAIVDVSARERFLSGGRPGTGPGSGAGQPSRFGQSAFGNSAFADSRPATQPGGTGGQGALRPEDLEKAVTALSRTLGPIARIVVRKSAAKAGTREQFIANVLSQLTPGVDAQAVQAELWRVLV